MIMKDSNPVTIFTDGACSGNPGRGGYGAVITQDSRSTMLSAGFRATTNNRMEMMAVTESLKSLDGPCTVILYSDSKYVVDGINKGWARKWRNNNWMRNKNEKALNSDLWERMLHEFDRLQAEIRWVKGHAGNEGNERADTLAVRASQSQNLEIDHGYENTTNKQPQLVNLDTESKHEKFPSSKLTHIDDSGKAKMVNISAKLETHREAIAQGRIVMQPKTLALIVAEEFEKGDVLGVARVAGIMGAKNTAQLIPLCHPLSLNAIAVDFELDTENNAVVITGTASTIGKTGVEMEAMTAVIISGLTIYDMCKAVDRSMRIDSVRLIKKIGGKRGDIILE